MRSTRLALAAVLAVAGIVAVLLIARHSGNRSAHGPLSANTPSTALAPPVAAAPSATAVQRQEAGLAPAAPGKLAHANEDGSETVEETTGDSGSHNPLLAAVASTMSAATGSAVAASALSAPTLWQAGVNYTQLVPAQPTSVAPGQVEVLEFFWYACPHCYDLDPQVEAWRKSKPAYISFSRVPVLWSEAHRATARLFYTLEALGKLEQLHGEVFKEIHVNHDLLVAPDPNDAAGTERLQAAFVKKFGISEEAFKQAYHSFAVDQKMQRAEELMIRYRIESVPKFVINGKYVADVSTAGSPEKLFALIDDLAAQEHKH